jgi:hypothetical protein
MGILKVNDIKEIKINNSETNANQLVLSDFGSITFFDDKVALNQQSYRKIFDKPFKEQQYKPWKKGIVKIVKKNGLDKIVVYRLFFGANIKANEIGMNKFNIQALCVIDGDSYTISKGSRLCFYWNHPENTVRSAYKLGLIALGLSIVSALFTLYQLLFY